ncbi:hypothetical protein GQ457_11G002340 [Hibiscus cannabinus]
MVDRQRSNHPSQSHVITSSLAHDFTFIVVVPIGTNISCGHVNPAITFDREIILWVGLRLDLSLTAVDLKRGSLGNIVPLAINLIVGANILADGASMNPIVSFGPALVSWTWTNQWVYLVEPLIGDGLVGLLYEFIFIRNTIPPLIVKPTGLN